MVVVSAMPVLVLPCSNVSVIKEIIYSDDMLQHCFLKNKKKYILYIFYFYLYLIKYIYIFIFIFLNKIKFYDILNYIVLLLCGCVVYKFLLHYMHMSISI